ncbi:MULTISPECIES: FecR family protein [Proteiniphilum]|nr:MULTISPECIES: FecR domain-containing protein [Proteiniphilum]
MKEPTEESENFWSEFTKRNPSNIGEFIQAKQILLAIRDDESRMLPDEEVDQLLDRIMDINLGRTNKKRRVVRYWMGVAAGIAACVIAVIMIVQEPGPLTLGQDKILSYVEKNKTINLDDTTVKLIISDQKIIVTEEVEPVIAYDSKEIKLATTEISKAESAEYNQLIVPYGKRSRLTLSDGTKIWVNAGTHLTYPVEFTDTRREIYVSGEVFLDIAHDTDRPFIVKTDNFDIRVLGTKFNVSTYENEINNVVLVSGSVKISQSGKRQDVFLQPNEMFELHEGQSMKKQVNAEYYTSWINGLYIVDNEKLEVVLKRLSKYYGKKIACSPETGQLRCSGKLDLKESLNDILDNLNLKYTSGNNTYKIY